MLSFQLSLSPTQGETNLRDGYELEINSTKKRKREELVIEGFSGSNMLDKQSHLETPLPSEWQRCLNIKSGEIHYLNTSTRKRTAKDPRMIPHQELLTKHMSLDLELNLLCAGSLAQHITKSKTILPSSSLNDYYGNTPLSYTCFENKRITSHELNLFPSSSDTLKHDDDDDDNEDDQKEMITAVCKKCHMLVMMKKFSPSCPNCKFMHPLDQETPALMERNLASWY